MKHLILALALLALPARAGILTPQSYDAAHFLPPPPAADSPQARSERQELYDIAARSSAAEIAAAAHDAKDESADLFNEALGFDLAATPKAFALINLVGDEEEDDTKAAKAFFHRDRPYVGDSRIKTCAPVKPGKAANSYPSGHATRGYAMALVLSRLVPDRSQAVLARAREYGEHRLVCGVHFRSDVSAGQQFGTVLALELMEDAGFKARMEAARAELRAAGH